MRHCKIFRPLQPTPTPPAPPPPPSPSYIFTIVCVREVIRARTRALLGSPFPPPFRFRCERRSRQFSKWVLGVREGCTAVRLCSTCNSVFEWYCNTTLIRVCRIRLPVSLKFFASAHPLEVAATPYSTFKRCNSPVRRVVDPTLHRQGRFDAVPTSAVSPPPPPREALLLESQLKNRIKISPCSTMYLTTNYNHFLFKILVRIQSCSSKFTHESPRLEI